MDSDEEQSIELPSMADFCLNEPLYTAFPFDKSNEKKLRNDIVNYRGNIDCYCMECGKSSVFQVAGNFWENRILIGLSNYFFQHTFHCSRNDKHQINFFFCIHNNTITKIGQHPSLANLATVEIQKYRKVLGDDRYAEFNRAVGLASHGVGIGAFVYLRRIFENLIEEAHQLNISSHDWDEDTYQRSRMDNKIALLKYSLPEFLVQNKSLYSILSKGLHELKESECLDAFPVTKLGIELILDEKLEKLEREKKIQQASKDIKELTQKLKSKGA